MTKSLFSNATYTSRWIVFLIDLSLSMQAFFFAYLIRFNFSLQFGSHDFLQQLPLVGLASILGFLIVGSFKGIVRHTGTKDAINVFWASTAVAAILFSIALITRGYGVGLLYSIPLSIISIHYLLNIVILIASRFIFKYLFDRIASNYKKPKNVLIYGAGDSGLLTYTTLSNSVSSKYKVVGFLDDAQLKIGKQFNRIRIYDPRIIDEKFIKKHDIEEVIVSIQNIKPFELFGRVDAFTSLPVTIKMVPPVKQWIDGELNVGQIKEVKIEDLLDRSPIKINNPVLRKELDNKVVLITGAAGSIGSEIANQVRKYDYKHLILLDQAESALYDLQQSFKRKEVENFSVELADIRNEDRLKTVFDNYQVDMIFHAAAYKHVPLMENNPYEAVRVNVFGSSLLMKMAISYKVQKFIMVSTDKAVNPTNVMGATKRVAEIYANCLNTQGKTKFVTTRFGNVLGSNGSVIPLFKRQIENGGPLTVTHRDITRFFMTIPEACQLVLEAGVMGNGGEIYVFDMGESVKIYDLAKKMIHLSGKKFPEEIDIKITGLRPGEKLYEELLSNEENTIPTYNEKIMIAKTENMHVDQIKLKIDALISDLNLEHVEIVKKIKGIVPEYLSNNSEFEKLDQPQVKVKTLKIS
ncbi:nucleoside-diphosphate sugar epimerase/dehydratase [Lutimonas halocynthiae]|uniref:polysaccharide biosynthesis protein n=1 Tax=Lutimonas halocynthiae TaxID=1446477 RepID=UPI0025B48304|nr:nucleoside-diphosphate sugar epimerase/dehydratase [Lutimonas halocynthiae]MDN3643803.1 nucleoside-diphosphate sugar epimerase/dehydratase [Lutimonas halocynthiae]